MMKMKIFGKSKEEIKELVKSGKVTVAVYGLGKVGLPLALAYASAGNKVIGVDINERIVEMVNSGRNYLPHEPGVDELLREFVNNKRITATTRLEKAAKESDVISIIVPTGIDEHGKPELNAIYSVSEAIGRGMDKGTLIILESTVPPGTTEGPVRAILERESGLKAGVDFGLVFSPERVKSGTVLKDFLENYPKIVGGINEKSTLTAAGFYEAIVKKGVITVMNARAAEAVKVFEGVYRYVNIALANELALLSELLGVDVLEIIKAANSQPYSHIHFPGAGVGGHCIPVYPFFLKFVSEALGLDLRFVNLSKIINEAMPSHIVDLVIESLNEAKKPINGSKIVIFGLTFRGDIKAVERSPAKPIINRLKYLKGEIYAHDPFLTSEEVKNEFGVSKIEDLWDALQRADCAVFVTDHSIYRNLDLEKAVSLMKKPAIIVDGRNIFDLNKVRKLVNEKHLIYRGVGRSKSLLEGSEINFENILRA